MKKIYDNVAYQISKKITNTYSTSFSLGIKALHPSVRPAIYAIYGYVRLADEIVDSFHEYDKTTLLNDFIADTEKALKTKISLNPILQAFQETVHKYNIDKSLIDQFIHSMRMDLNQSIYSKASYDEYILGSAEVVGLMCLYVFVQGNNSEYAKLKPYAMKLGSVFQKINFLRDLKDDFYTLGRSYFPGIDLSNFKNEDKIKIEKEIKQEFNEALVGIKLLPSNSKLGVYLAYRYYYRLFKKIQLKSCLQITQQRTRVPNSEKLFIMLTSYFNLRIGNIS